jgi:hypothetical protein
MSHRPGRFCLARLFSLTAGTDWKTLQGGCVWVEGAGRVDEW